jgi:hypothetical protein
MTDDPGAYMGGNACPHTLATQKTYRKQHGDSFIVIKDDVETLFNNVLNQIQRML